MQDLMPPINTPDSAFHDGDPTTGQLGTIVTALWLNNVQSATRDVQLEIKNVLAKAGIQPDPKKTNQLAEAISQIIGSGNYASTAYVDNGLNKKIDKANISGQKGNDNDKVPSLNLFTTEIGKLAALGYSYSKIESDGRYQPKGNYATKAELTSGLNTKLNITGGTVTRNGAAITLKNVTSGGNHYLQFQNVDGKRRAFVGFGSDTNKNFSIVNDEVGSNFTLKESGATINGIEVMRVGDFGLGGNSLFNSVDTCAFFGASTNAIRDDLGLPPALGAGFQSVYNNQRRAMLYIDTSGRCYVRFSMKSGSDKTTVWYEAYTTKNTTKDRNGNLRDVSSSDALSDYPVGSPIPWPQATAPSGFLVCNGQTFNKTTYPLLATAYPSGKLPDLRSEFIRGLDAGRNIDSARTVLSAQGDAIRNITGEFAMNGEGNMPDNKSGWATGAFKKNLTGLKSHTEQSLGGISYTFDASRVVPTANENRPRNIAFLYIVRAA